MPLLERIGGELVEFSILMYIMVILSHLIFVSLILAVFTSVFVKSRKNGHVFLIIYILLSMYSLTTVFKNSILMGSYMLITYICLGVVTYFVIKKKLSKGTKI